MHARALTATLAAAVLGSIATTTAQAATPQSAASQKASELVASRPAALRASSSDEFVQQPVISSPQGLQYVPYKRTYKNLPVVGGDFVVVTQADGDVASTSVAQKQKIDVETKPALSEARAAKIARGASKADDVDVESTKLVVDAQSDTPALAFQSVVTGKQGKTPSRLRVLVDANTGAVLSTREEVHDGTGSGAFNGPNPLSIATSGSGSSFSMTDPARPGISCRNFSSGAVLTGPDDAWGNGNGTNIETGCVDALFSVQREWDMLKNWYGRNGITGAGGGFPIYVGLNDRNAYWDGSSVSIGHNTAGQWISSLDVVGHEFGHALDSYTPGWDSGNGVSEATGDIFGALTEAYANESAAYDPPDYTVGEEINLVGSGPIRYMYQPSLSGDPNCYSSAIPGMETHAAAGPLNHWFYLLAEGSNPTNGQPRSPTCNGTTVTGIGAKAAGAIFYNAMLSKTYGMTYLRYRTATLNAAKNLTPGSCKQFNTVKAAWDAVSVPAQAGDPTCTTDAPWSGTGTATTTVTSDGTTRDPVFDYSTTGYNGSWTFNATAKSARKQPIAWRYKGFHAWFSVTVAIEQFVIRNGTEIVKQTLQSAGPVNCCAAPSGGFDYSGTATFDLQPGDVYGFRMSGGNWDSDNRLIGTLSLTI